MEGQQHKHYEVVDSLRWPAMPNPYDRSDALWIWPRARVRAFEQVNPQNSHGEGFLLFPYALAVFDRAKRHILSVVIEQTDFRVLSQLTGERMSELTGGMKGYLSVPMIATYDADNHEELGPFEGKLRIDTVMEVLVEVVADKLDLWEEAVRREISS